MKRIKLLVGILPIFLQSSLEGMKPSLSLWNVVEDFLIKQLSKNGTNGSPDYFIGRIKNLSQEDNQTLLDHFMRRTEVLWNHFTEYKELKDGERGHVKEIGAVAFTPDSECILTGGADGRILAWNREDGKICAEFLGHQETRITSLTVARASRSDTFFILSSSYDKTAKVWDSKTGKVLQEFVHPEAVLSAVPDENWEYILTICSDNKVYLWNFETGQCIRVFDGNFRRIVSISFAAQDQTVIAAGLGQAGPYKLCFWQRNTGTDIKTLKGECLESFSTCAFSCDGNYALKGSLAEGVSLWNLVQGAQQKNFVCHRATSLAISEDKRYFATASYGELYLWNNCGALIRKLEEQKSLVLTLAISRDNASLVTGSSDGIVRLWTCKSAIKKLKDFEKGLLVHWLAQEGSINNVSSHSAWGPLWRDLPTGIQGILTKTSFSQEFPLREQDETIPLLTSRE